MCRILFWGSIAMCTAVCYRNYFGRNLDLEYGYHEQVTVTPRNYPFRFRKTEQLNRHFAMIGMATVSGGYPLYYEATNEHGLSMAALNFPQNACYQPEIPEMENVSPFEMIPWILGQCRTVEQAKELLLRLNPVNIPFSDAFPLSPLHWIIADENEAIVAEPMAGGLRIFDNPIGILTNEPPFDYHLYNLSNYLNVSADPAENRFSRGFELKSFSNGQGGFGLPGDYASPSRFVRAAFVKANSVSTDLNQFFHILSSVAMPRGAVRLATGKYEITRYSCCCDTNRGIYYYTTYENSRITGVDMFEEDLEGNIPISYPLVVNNQIFMQNQKKDGNSL